MKTFKLILSFFAFFPLWLNAQQPVPVGKGSYAEYPPLYKSRTDEHSGDQSQKMLNKKLYITDKMKGKPVPTNDWWTDLLVTEFSGNLWAYPIMINAEDYGIFVEFPKHWTSDGCEMKSASQLQISGQKFRPKSADVDAWHDWGFEFIMQDTEKQLRVTLAHGMPFTWLETENMILQIPYKGEKIYTENGEASFPLTASKLVFMMGEDAYGLFAPENTNFRVKNDMVEITFPSQNGYLSVGVLPDKDLLADFAHYAYSVPVETKVSWSYDESAGKLNTEWNIRAKSLKGENAPAVIQGFIPHHYKRSDMDFSFLPYQYDTPRGKMKMAAGNRFNISYDFSGIVPYWAVPGENEDLQNPYKRARMIEMIDQYANKGGFGGDTYWGGKGLVQMALYMTFAHEMGETELFEKCKHRLREALVDWFTFTPGEERFFFARYDNWGALVGYDTSYDSDTFNDHHFHYGYFTYAASLLAMFDDDFKTNYGGMITHLAKDYANWEREDENYPLFRTFDPWAGHSYAGGLAGWGGNGQESSSEAMQGWGGVYTLGLALGDKTIRDAGIFGWLLESRGAAEYWFDRDRENINYDLYTRPYNSNLTSQGIGWWTWFSGDPVWMHSIQWLPISPMQYHLYQDLEYAEWEYTQMWNGKEIAGWLTTPSGSALSNESGLGNVVLSYLQIFNPDSAASVFDRMWEHNMPIAKNVDTGGISYYATHSHRTYGDIQWDIHSDIPSSNCYYNSANGKYTYVVYNPDGNERLCTFYRNGAVMKSFKVPARKYIVYNDDPYLDDILLAAPSLVVEPSATVQLSATAITQYGSTADGITVNWSVSGGMITNSGLFTAPASKGEVVVVASSGNKVKQLTLRIDEKPVVETARILPEILYLEPGKEINFYLEMKDQYGLDFKGTAHWSIEKEGVTVKADSVFNLTAVGNYTVKAAIDNQIFATSFKLLPAFPNIALRKTAVSSSEENAGTKTASATDGDIATRWGSEHRDGEWIYVDLSERSYVGRVAIRWEASYASLYEIQISDNSRDWVTVKRVNGSGGYENTEVDNYARYVRMYGLERGSNYGYSLYEFEVYGIPASLDEQAVFGLQILPEITMLKEDEPVQLYAKAYNGLAEEIEASITWSYDGNGEITTGGLFTPGQYGKVTVAASTGNAKTEKTYMVEESLKLRHIQLSPKTASLIINNSQVFEIVSKDQFEVDFPVDDIEYEIIGEGATFVNNTFTANKVGEFKLIAGKGLVKDTAVINVGNVEDINLALNKTAFASSSENNGLLPVFANDGDFNTRWGSEFRDNESLTIDLEAGYVINKVNLYWQESYATSYRIEVSTDEEEWTTVYTNPACTGGYDPVEFAAVAARFVRIVCMTRSSGYGSSLWEVEVYGIYEWKDPQPVTFVLQPNPFAFYLNELSAVDAVIMDQYGMVFATEEPIVYSVNGGGNFDSENNFIPTEEGEFVMTVTYKDLVRQFDFTVYPQKELTYLSVTPSYYKLKVGEELSLQAKGLDQYGTAFAVDVIWNASGGNIDANGLFSSQQAGIFTITATAGVKTATATVEVISVSATNLVYNKPVEASSGQGNAAGAVDDNGGTRWESLHQDGPEWLKVDLEGAFLLTDIEIVWETASAADYQIQLSIDGENWNTIIEVNGKTGARTDKFRISATGGYLRIYCTRRSTSWGYSIIDMRVYGVGMQEGEPYYAILNDPGTNIEVGETVAFSADAYDFNNRQVTDYPLLWSVSGGGTISADGLFKAMFTGEYDLSVSCGIITVSYPINVFSTSGVSDAGSNEIEVEIHNGTLVVRTEHPVESLMLYDLSGRIVKVQSYRDQNEYVVNINGKKGFFIVAVKTSRGGKTLKLLVD